MDDKTNLEPRKIKLKTAIIVVVVAVAGVFAYVYKDLFIAATVNGRPISRFAVISELEKKYGKQALDELITRKLILDELNQEKIAVTDEEVNTNIKNLENQIISQGGTLAQLLATQGMTTTDLKDQISINSRIEKLFIDKIQVSDDEVSQYLKDGGFAVPTGQEDQYNEQTRNQLKSEKLDQAIGVWIDSIRSQASIHYFADY